MTDELEEEWRRYLQQLMAIKFVRIPRYIFTIIEGSITHVELHGFCDSSEQAYCAVVYARTKSKDGFASRIVTSKTKVSPIKKMHIPKLELLSCELLVEVMGRVCELLRDAIIVEK